MYAGYGSFLLRDLPFDAIEFFAYEQLKHGEGRPRMCLAFYLLLASGLRAQLPIRTGTNCQIVLFKAYTVVSKKEPSSMEVSVMGEISRPPPTATWPSFPGYAYLLNPQLCILYSWHANFSVSLTLITFGHDRGWIRGHHWLGDNPPGCAKNPSNDTG